MKERNLKLAAIILAAVIGIGIVVIITSIVNTGAGSLHPAKNDALVKWESFISEQTAQEEVTSTREGFQISEQ